jgi:large subunit ribosomal protein L4
MKIDVIKLDGAKSGSVDLPDDIFGIAEIRGDILQRCVNWQLAKRRAGTHKVQTRNEVSRTGKKMYRQKGTGGARHGSRKAAQFVGGARAHGPVVRSHAIDLTKKFRALALRHALSSKAKDGTLVVLDAATMTDAKTASFRAHFANIGVKNALVIAGPEVDANFGLAARNIPNVDVLPNAGLNVYDILRRETLILTKSALEGIDARFNGEKTAAEAPAKAAKPKAAPKAAPKAKVPSKAKAAKPAKEAA